jgi:hypothetical protein
MLVLVPVYRQLKRGRKHMTGDLQGDMITALENFANAVENGTLSHQIIRALVEAIDAAR